VLRDVAFVVLTGLGLGEARDEVGDVPVDEVRLVVDRVQGSAVGMDEGVHGDADRGEDEVVPDVGQDPQTFLLGRDLGRQGAAHERRVQGALGKVVEMVAVVARCHGTGSTSWSGSSPYLHTQRRRLKCFMTRIPSRTQITVGTLFYYL
jgi:hypothetical protein